MTYILLSILLFPPLVIFTGLFLGCWIFRVEVREGEDKIKI
jgi:hypothetical protein